MENSINSSNSEPVPSDLRNIFKKSTDFYQTFEVSLEESVGTGQSNKSETDLDTSTRTQKILPFKKSRKSVQQPFNISLSDSFANSEFEKSETFVKPPVFKKKSKSLVDFFNVSFNETNSNLQSDVFSKSVDDSVFLSKTNPFEKCISENKSVTGNISSLHVSGDEKDESSIEFQRHSAYDIDGDEADSTTFATKQNPFKKTIEEESDSSLPLPSIPSVTPNLSQTIEKPPVPDSPTTDTNPLSVWEQKFVEIVSNAEKRSQKALSKMNSNSLLKSKPLKKSNQNKEKPSEDLNKYKPPKLIKPAPFATKKMYDYIIKRLEPKYGIDRMIESENLVLSICETVKKVTRRKTHQKRLIQNLKKEMAKSGLIETTMDFYEFVIKFLPYSFRVKVVPCLQPVTNLVYPPKDVVNPFDKIL